MSQRFDLAEKDVLVTGGMGFIGSHIVDSCLQSGAKVRIIDDFSNGYKENLEHHQNNKKLEIVKGDIRSPKTLENVISDIKIIFHQAAKVNVTYSLVNPRLVNDVNTNGSINVLNTARKFDVPKIVVASSSSVYGDTPILPKVETMQLQPISPYGATKLAAESMALAFSKSYGMDITALRYFNVYGPRQRGGPYAGVISIFIDSALEGTKLPIESDGHQSRDFTYVGDVVIANLLGATTSNSSGKVYNIAYGQRTTILDLANEIIQLTNSKSRIEFYPPRPGDIRHSLADISAAKKDLNYEPQTSLRTGLQKTIKWVLKKACKKGS